MVLSAGDKEGATSNSLTAGTSRSSDEEDSSLCREMSAIGGPGVWLVRVLHNEQQHMATSWVNNSL